MSEQRFRILSEVRGVGLFDGRSVAAFRDLTPGQPLILAREPENPVDRSAVRVETLLGVPIGYVQKEHAARVSEMLDRGEILLAKIFAPPGRAGRRLRSGRRSVVWPIAVIWRDGSTEIESVTRTALTAEPALV